MPAKSDRTEKATPKRKKEIREEGNVARSAEIGGWASFMLIASMLPKLGGVAANRINGFMFETVNAMNKPSLNGAVDLVGKGLEAAFFSALPIILVAAGVGVAISLAQVGLRFTPKSLAFKFSKISPKAGLNRLVSVQGVWTMGKTFLKLSVLAVVGYVIMKKMVHTTLGGNTLPLQATILSAVGAMVSLLRYIGLLALIIAAVDYFFQRRSHERQNRMTKQEVRDEYKESDVRPEVKRAIKGNARKLSQALVMAAVANADVIVTNPTHYAVAIAYDKDRDRAPRVVAKGADFNALAIRDKALSCGIAVVENPPLARTLHSSCEVNDIVPEALYAAVAQLLAFVYSLSASSRVFNYVHRMTS